MKTLLISFLFMGISPISFSQSPKTSGYTGITKADISSADSSILNYKFYNTKGEVTTLNKYKGKVIFIDFWFTGCSACVGYYQETLKHVQKYYEGKKDVIFVSISIDKDNIKWLNTVNIGYAIDKKGENILAMTDRNGINLRCIDGDGSPIIKGLNILYYPTLMLFDRKGKLITRSNKILKTDGKQSVIKYIELAKKSKGI